MKSRSYETTLAAPGFTCGSEESPYFMELVLAVFTITSPAEEMAGTGVKSDSEDTEHKSHSLSKIIV